MYRNIDSFTVAEGLARASTGDSSTYIDSTGKQLISPKYNVQSFSEGLGLVEEAEKGPFYFIDKTGKKVLDLPAYTNAFSFYHGYAVVANKDGLYGMIDKTGKEILPCIYEEGPDELRADNFIVHLPAEGKKIINIKGGAILPVKDFKELFYDEVNNKYALGNDSGWYLLDDKGAVLKKLPADGLFYPRDGAYVANRESKDSGTQWAAMDGNGNLVVPFGRYNSIEQWSDGLACVGIETGTSPNKEQEGVTDVHMKTGYIDKTGKEVIPLQFEDLAQSFNEGMAIAMQKGKIGFINKTGQWTILPQFDKAGPFNNGFAKVNSGTDAFYIDTKGNRVQ